MAPATVSAAKSRPKRKSISEESETPKNEVLLVEEMDGVEEDNNDDATRPSPKRQKLPVREKKGPAIAEKEDDDSDEGSDSDSDAAPEAISTVEAARTSRLREQEAKKSAKALATERRRRLQERDARLKAQLEGRKARDFIKAEMKRSWEAKQSRERQAEAGADAEEEEEPEEEALDNPNMLPLAFLESDDEDEEDGDDDETTPPPPKSSVHKKLGNDDEDAVIDGQAFRVARAQTKTLAPVSRREGKQVRRELMKRNRVARPSRRKGFFSRKR